MYDVITAAGWALLIGNLAFQAMKSMFAGLGHESEDPAALLFRTGIYGFLLLTSRQIFMMGLNMGKIIMDLIGFPGYINVTMPDFNYFMSVIGDKGWLLSLIISFFLGFQIIKLFFEIGERYVVVCLLILFAPLGFAMGGSKSTKDIATGYIRMFGTMSFLMVFNLVILRLVLSGLGTMPSGLLVIPWTVFVVALMRTVRKADNLIARIGLNPAISGDPGGRRSGAFLLTMLAAKTLIKSAAGGATSGASGNATSGGISKLTKLFGGKSKANNAAKPSAGAAKSSTATIAKSGVSNLNQQNKSDVSSSQNNSQNNSQNTLGSPQNQGSNGQKPRFGSQDRKPETAIGNNNQSVNPSPFINTKIKQGGNMKNMQNIAPSSENSRNNSNRFGANPSANDTKSALVSGASSVGSNAKTAGLQSTSSATTAITQTQSPPKVAVASANANSQKTSVNSSTGNPQIGDVRQGKNAKAQRIADSLKSGSSSSSNNGKNPTSAPVSVDKGKNNKGQNPAKSMAKTPVNAGVQPEKGKNNIRTRQSKNGLPSTPTPQGQKPRFGQALPPVKGMPIVAENGKNNVKPTAIETANQQDFDVPLPEIAPPENYEEE